MSLKEEEENARKIDPKEVLKVVARIAAVRAGNPPPDEKVYDSLSDEDAIKMLNVVQEIEKTMAGNTP